MLLKYPANMKTALEAAYQLNLTHFVSPECQAELHKQHWILLMSDLPEGVLTDKQTLHINFMASLKFPLSWAE